MRFRLTDQDLAPLAGLTLLAFALALLGLVAGCGAQGRSASESFLADVSSFNNAVRWDRREEALARMTPALHSDYLDRQEEIEEDVRVDDWELDRAELDSRRGTARVRVHFWWHREREAIVKKTYVDQKWRKVGSRWLLVRAKSRVGDPMPTFEKPELASADGDTR